MAHSWSNNKSTDNIYYYYYYKYIYNVLYMNEPIFICPITTIDTTCLLELSERINIGSTFEYV